MPHFDTKHFETNDPFLFDEEPLYEVSRTKRFLNYIIDIAAFYAFAIVIGITLGLLGLEYVLEEVNETLLGILIIVTYYWGLESIFGQTIGKMITGCKVVTEDGQEPTPLDTLKRTLCRLIPFEPLSFLGSGPGWHDRISGTRVVEK